MTPRAAPMSPENRRKAIVDVVIPLLVEHGGDVSTRRIAEAAGVAEGTIFRVFADKRELLLAAAQEAMDPTRAMGDWGTALDRSADLRTKVVAVSGRLIDRMHTSMSVMLAIRNHLMACARDDEGPQRPPGPPPFVQEAQAELHRRMVELFDEHREELAVAPETAALALRGLVASTSRMGFGLGVALEPEQIADVLLDGIRRRDA